MSNKQINILDRMEALEAKLYLATVAIYDILAIDHSPDFICKKRAIKALEEMRNFGKTRHE